MKYWGLSLGQHKLGLFNKGRLFSNKRRLLPNKAGLMGRYVTVVTDVTDYFHFYIRGYYFYNTPMPKRSVTSVTTVTSVTDYQKGSS